jgi:hypothetical protein
VLHHWRFRRGRSQRSSEHVGFVTSGLLTGLRPRPRTFARRGGDFVTRIVRRQAVQVHPGLRRIGLQEAGEAGGEAGLPVVFSGYYPTLDEIARIARLLQNHGMHDGEAILHPELTASALYRRDETGIEAPAFLNEIEHTRYQLSFWSWATQEGDGGCIARTPFMMGFGGNLVAVLANGATAFRFVDAMAYSPWNIVETARVFGPLCE